MAVKPRSAAAVKVIEKEPTVCIHCRNEVEKIIGKDVMAGRTPTHKHRRSQVICPKAGQPLYPEDVR